MQKALRAALAAVVLATGAAVGQSALAAIVTSASPPTGFVTVMNNDQAKTALKKLTGGPSNVLINGFVTTDDLQRLSSGEIPHANRYILVLQPAQFAGRPYPPGFFAAVATQARQTDYLAAARDTANSQMAANKNDRPNGLQDMHVDSAGTGNVVVDTPTCIARSGHTVMAAHNKQVTVQMIVAFVYANQQIYTTSGYAHDTPEDKQWLASDFLGWLRGVCGAG